VTFSALVFSTTRRGWRVLVRHSTPSHDRHYPASQRYGPPAPLHHTFPERCAVDGPSRPLPPLQFLRRNLQFSHPSPTHTHTVINTTHRVAKQPVTLLFSTFCIIIYIYIYISSSSRIILKRNNNAQSHWNFVNLMNIIMFKRPLADYWFI